MRATIRAALALALVSATGAPAFAQSGRTAEIEAIRAEMARLTARLDKLERDEAPAHPGEAAAPVTPAVSPQADVASPDPIPADAARDLATVRRRFPELALSEADLHTIAARTVPAGTLDRPLQPDGLAAELSASADTTTVAIKLARSVSIAGEDRGIYTTYALTASAPLASGRFSDIATLDGFVNSSKLRFQVGRYIRRITEPDLHPAYPVLVETAKKACRARLGEAAKECAIDLISSEFFATYAPELEAAFLALGRMRPGPHPGVDWSARAFGIEGSIGYKAFNFLLPGPARKADGSRIPFGAKAYYSYLPDVRINSITGAAEYQRTFKDASGSALCPGAPALTEQICLTGPLGKPAKTEKLLLSLEYRQGIVFDKSAFIPGLGLAPMATYDALNDEFGIDLPIYLVADAKGGLTGGVRFGYTTDGNDFIAGVFVGTAFSIR